MEGRMSTDTDSTETSMKAQRGSDMEGAIRPEPLMLPAQHCAARLPRGFRRLLDDFAREVLRYQPYNIDKFGAEYFGNMVNQRRANPGQPLEYQPQLDYIKAQFQPGNRVVVPTEDQNWMGTQTTGSDHYFVARGDKEGEEEEADAYDQLPNEETGPSSFGSGNTGPPAALHETNSTTNIEPDRGMHEYLSHQSVGESPVVQARNSSELRMSKGFGNSSPTGVHAGEDGSRQSLSSRNQLGQSQSSS
ncbi:hypothetical protein RvY_13665 [Ramazzottius varieornatus]|uniref:RIIa domain-containing protein n=1 Tax=Ramazzottius varieornatus TaxID=947166 RepID=A0A1D1VQU9_RAMVA|nr:hypothetical protein RvY_13665 [Ramazzottius varieornatus]